MVHGYNLNVSGFDVHAQPVQVTGDMFELRPDGAIACINPKTRHPIFVIRGGALIIQAGHGAAKIFFSVPLASLSTFLSVTAANCDTLPPDRGRDL